MSARSRAGDLARKIDVAHQVWALNSDDLSWLTPLAQQLDRSRLWEDCHHGSWRDVHGLYGWRCPSADARRCNLKPRPSFDRFEGVRAGNTLLAASTAAVVIRGTILNSTRVTSSRGDDRLCIRRVNHWLTAPLGDLCTRVMGSVGQLRRRWLAGCRLGAAAAAAGWRPSFFNLGTSTTHHHHRSKSSPLSDS